MYRFSEENIRKRAYYKWQSAGCPSGDGLEFWLEAEKEVLTQKNDYLRIFGSVDKMVILPFPSDEPYVHCEEAVS